MYEKFYNLRELPFRLTPDPRYLFLAPQHKYALALLRYGLAHETGFCLLTGEIGCGKTTAIKSINETLGSTMKIGILAGVSPGTPHLLPWVCQTFGIPTVGSDEPTLRKAFLDYIEVEAAASQRALLIVDEAQNLRPDHMEELRLLSNTSVESTTGLQVILVGQPELRTSLQRPELKQFAQRISLDYHLEPLGLDATRAYVRHRLTVAGGSPDLFSPTAVSAAYLASGGIPRLINQLCDTALVYGYSEQQPHIEVELMRSVINDRARGGVLPIRNPLDTKLGLASTQ